MEGEVEKFLINEAIKISMDEIAWSMDLTTIVLSFSTSMCVQFTDEESVYLDCVMQR